MVSQMSKILIIVLTLICSSAIILSANVDAVTIPAESVKSEISKEIMKFTESSGKRIQISVPFSSDIEIGDVTNPIFKVNVRGKKILKERIPISLEIFDENNKYIRRISLAASIKEKVKAAVASMDLTPGSVINNECVMISELEIPFGSFCFSDFEQLKDLKIKRPVKKGEIFTEKNTIMIPVIKRGDKVKIKSIIGSVTVESEGTARADGGKDQIIRVYNEVTKKTLLCKVVEPGLVSVGKKE